jgi:hypothetical protein
VPQQRCWEQVGCEPAHDDIRSREYRYWLRYRLRDRVGLPPLVVIQLNPSTAGRESEDSGDATSRRVAGWASRRRLYGSVVFLNLFALRCTDPQGLLRQPYDVAVGPEGDRTLIHEADPPGATLVAAWGKGKAGALGRLVARRRDEVCDLLAGAEQTVHWLAPTGHPLHGRCWEDRHELEPVSIARLRAP